MATIHLDPLANFVQKIFETQSRWNSSIRQVSQNVFFDQFEVDQTDYDRLCPCRPASYIIILTSFNIFSFLNPFFIHVYVGWVNFRLSTSRILELTFLFVYNRIWSCSLTEDLIVNGLMISRPISSFKRCSVLFHFMSDRIVIYKKSFSI